MKDISHISARHSEINLRLEQWGRWVTQTPKAWSVSPMFRQYRSHAWQWEMPELVVHGNPLDHTETERAVAVLPSKHRTVIRWAYAFPWVPPTAVRRELGLTKDGLVDTLNDARDMLINRLRERLVERD